MTLYLRDVLDTDLPIFFEHQRDSAAAQMADFPSRDEAAFMAHWTTKVLGNPTGIVKAIIYEGQVVGNLVCFEQGGERLVGYWLGRTFWGRGIATRALAEFLKLIPTRPLYAYVAHHNHASRRVLEKCGFTVVTDAENADITEVKLQLGATPQP